MSPTFTRGHLSSKSANNTHTYDAAEAADQAEDHTTIYATTLAGDPTKLRGIPAIGRNVTGAIPGTSPHALRR
jgi:hypothetical protein